MNTEEIIKLIKEKEDAGFKHYVYALLKPCGTPFYIGKGSGKRCLKHHNKTQFNKRKCNIVDRLKEDGTPHTTDILSFHISSENAYNKEREIITELGREYDGGILTNMTKGGYGGFPHITEEHRKNLSLSHMGHKPTKEAVKKQSESMKAYANTPQGKEHMRKAAKAAHSKPSAIIKRSKSLERAWKVQGNGMSEARYRKNCIFEINNKIYIGTMDARLALGGIGQGTLYTRIAQGVIKKLGTVGTHPHLVPVGHEFQTSLDKL